MRLSPLYSFQSETVVFLPVETTSTDMYRLWDCQVNDYTEIQMGSSTEEGCRSTLLCLWHLSMTGQVSQGQPASEGGCFVMGKVLCQDW